jgi:hypothetical protein
VTGDAPCERRGADSSWQLYASVMLAQMQRQEDEEKAEDEKTNGQTLDREKKAEKVAAESQRRATRNTTANGTTAAQPAQESAASKKKGRGKPKKQDSNITSYFKKEDLEKKADNKGVKDALKDAADDDKIQTSDVGIQNLKSARQPKLMEGGTMRAGVDDIVVRERDKRHIGRRDGPGQDYPNYSYAGTSVGEQVIWTFPDRRTTQHNKQLGPRIREMDTEYPCVALPWRQERAREIAQDEAEEPRNRPISCCCH